MLFRSFAIAPVDTYEYRINFEETECTLRYRIAQTQSALPESRKLKALNPFTDQEFDLNKPEYEAAHLARKIVKT